MKLTIESGARTEDVVKAIENFLKEECSEYKNLKNTLSIYITLKDDEGNLCPKNEKEYVLDTKTNTYTDVEMSRKMGKIHEILEGWNGYVKKSKDDFEKAKKEKEKTQKSLEKAIRENMHARTISTREKNLVKCEDSLYKAKERFELAEILDDRVKENLISFHIEKETFKSSYKYNLYVSILFENVNGQNYFFSWIEHPYDSYGFPCGRVDVGSPKYAGEIYTIAKNNKDATV